MAPAPGPLFHPHYIITDKLMYAAGRSYDPARYAYAVLPQRPAGAARIGRSQRPAVSLHEQSRQAGLTEGDGGFTLGSAASHKRSGMRHISSQEAAARRGNGAPAPTAPTPVACDKVGGPPSGTMTTTTLLTFTPLTLTPLTADALAENKSGKQKQPPQAARSVLAPTSAK